MATATGRYSPARRAVSPESGLLLGGWAVVPQGDGGLVKLTADNIKKRLEALPGRVNKKEHACGTARSVVELFTAFHRFSQDFTAFHCFSPFFTVFHSF